MRTLRVDAPLLLRFGSAIARTFDDSLVCPIEMLSAPLNWPALLRIMNCQGALMRVHQNQVNPNAQLDAMYAAQKATAKRAAEQTRKKLFESASELAGDAEAEACVVKLGARGESGAERQQQSQQRARKQKKEHRDPGDAESSISDWHREPDDVPYDDLRQK
jgi:hypothetical protein